MPTRLENYRNVYISTTATHLLSTESLIRLSWIDNELFERLNVCFNWLEIPNAEASVGFVLLRTFFVPYSNKVIVIC